MLESALAILFPKRCAGCGGGAWPFCSACLGEVVPLTQPWCERCGLPASRPVSSCRDCPPAQIATARAPFLFSGPVRSAVHRLKFAGWRPVAEALGEAMAVVAPDARGADVVTWVPLSRRRRAERGFDQAAALASVVGRRLEVPVAGLLVRNAVTAPQARRGAAARRSAMSGVFQASTRPPTRVLLVDDVLTTGATAAGCARALLEAGADEVSLLTAARAAPGRVPSGVYSAGLTPGSVVARGAASR